MSFLSRAKDAVPEVVSQRVLKFYYLRKLKAAIQADAFSRDIDMQVMRRIVKAGHTVVDIGANFGYYTAFLSMVTGKSGHVFSIEPIPHTYALLCNNIRRLQLTNVTPLNYAISDESGTSVMEIPHFNDGGSNYYQARIVPSATEVALPRNRSVVATATLDSLLASASAAIRFIKIDVEGHELRVLAGAKQVIAKHRPELYIEVWDNPEQPASDAWTLFQELGELGYSPYVVCDDKPDLRERAAGEIKNDYFFLTVEGLRAFREQYPPLLPT